MILEFLNRFFGFGFIFGFIGEFWGVVSVWGSGIGGFGEKYMGIEKGALVLAGFRVFRI